MKSSKHEQYMTTSTHLEHTCELSDSGPRGEVATCLTWIDPLTVTPQLHSAQQSREIPSCTNTSSDKRARIPINRKRGLEAAIVMARAAGNTINAVMELTGASGPRVFQVLNAPEGMNRIREERARIGAEITAALTAHARQAADYLLTIVNDVAAPDGARVRAAGLLLSEARAWKAEDIDERLVALENDPQRKLRSIAN